MAVVFTLLLFANFLTSASCCIQCNSKVVEIFKKIKTKTIPIQVRDSRLRKRCEKLVTGMAGNFFKDYAVKHFTGMIEISNYNILIEHIKVEAETFLHSRETDQDFLDALMMFRNKTTMMFKRDLLIYRGKACSSTECGWLKLDVFSCSKCQKVKPSCLSPEACKGKDEERLALVFDEEQMTSDMLHYGLSTVALSAFVLLVVLSIMALMYWLRKKHFVDRTMLVNS